MLKNLMGLLFFVSTLSGGEVLIVGTNAEYPPFTFREGKEFVGFDIDIAKEVAKRLKKEIEIKDMPFDALIPEIILGKVDFVAAGMSYTEERAKRVSFTKSYTQEDPLVIFSKQNLTLGGLQGKTVVVNEGFTSDLFISSQKDLEVIRLPTQVDGFLAVKNGRAEAFVTAKSTVNAFFKENDPKEFYVNTIEGTGETCSLVVPKGKKERLKEIEQALDAMEKDGTLQQLKTKWGLL